MVAGLCSSMHWGHYIMEAPEPLCDVLHKVVTQTTVVCIWNGDTRKMAEERDPARRVRELVQFAGQVRVDNSIAPNKYFRSGVEMEKMVS